MTTDSPLLTVSLILLTACPTATLVFFLIAIKKDAEWRARTIAPVLRVIALLTVLLTITNLILIMVAR